MSDDTTKALNAVIHGGGATMVGPNFTMQKVVGIAIDDQELRNVANLNEDEQHEYQMELVKKFHVRIRNLFN